MKDQPPSKESQLAQEILKKVEQQTPDEKRVPKEKTSFGNTPFFKMPVFSIDILKRNFKTYCKDLNKKIHEGEYKHMFVVTIFLMMSSYACVMLQRQYLAKKGIFWKSKTQHEREVEQQHKKISKLLENVEFQSVPIKDEIERNDYKHQLYFDSTEDLQNTIEDEKVIFNAD